MFCLFCRFIDVKIKIKKKKLKNGKKFSSHRKEKIKKKASVVDVWVSRIPSTKFIKHLCRL